MDGKPFYVKTTFYVRETRTLAVAQVGARVGGPGSPVWRGGWSLGIGAGALADVAPDRVMDRLLVAMATRENASPMGPEARAAWMRTWRAVP